VIGTSKPKGLPDLKNNKMFILHSKSKGFRLALKTKSIQNNRKAG
jgi:hypothetical protein